MVELNALSASHEGGVFEGISQFSDIAAPRTATKFLEGDLIESVGWIAVVDSLEDGFAEDG